MSGKSVATAVLYTTLRQKATKKNGAILPVQIS